MRNGTLADFKRYIRNGARFVCVENTFKHELDGQEREIVKAQTNGWFWREGGNPGRYWTNMPKASDILSYSTNGFGLVYFKLRAPVAGDHSITLEFMADPS